MNITIVPTNATPSLEDEVTILLPASDNAVDALKKGAEENEYLCLGARLANKNDDFSVTWDVPAMLDALAWSLARVSMPQVMGNGKQADLLRIVQRLELDAAHESLYTFLRLHDYEFFYQDNLNKFLGIGAWAKTKDETAQFPRPKWEAARIAYERIRALQNEAGTQASFVEDEHEQYEPSPYDGTCGEE